MAIIPIRKPWTRQPPQRPLPMSEMARRNGVRLVYYPGDRPQTLNANAGYSAASVGRTLSNSSATSGGVTVEAIGLTGSDLTIMMLVRVTGWAATNSTLMSIPYGTTWVSPYSPLLFRRDINGLRYFYCNSTSFEDVDLTIAPSADGAWHWLELVRSGARVFGYVDGSTGGEKTLSLTPDYSTNKEVTVFGAPPLSTTEGVIGDCVFAMAASQALPDTLRASIRQNPWQLIAPQVLHLPIPAAATVQYAHPTTDTTAGAWTPSTGVDLFACIDESAADDADYISTTSASTCKFKIGTLTDPAVSTGHILDYRIQVTTGTLYARLREGTTLIAERTHTTADAASLTTFNYTLSAGEANSITDYTNLYIEFESA